MSAFKRAHFIAAPAFVILMGGTAASALTADQVWTSWKDGAGLIGLEVTAATESNSGGVLTLNGVSIAPPGQTNKITISDMTLTEQADGSVVIVPGAAIGLDGAGEGEGSFALEHDGLTITARDGDAGGVVYDYAADRLTAKVDAGYEGYSFDANTPAQRVSNLIDVHFTGLSGSYADTPGANRSFALSLAASTFGYDVAMDDPNMKMTQSQKSETKDVEFAGTLTLPSTIPLASIQTATDFGTALKEGLAFTMTAKQGESTGSVSQQDEYFPMEFTMTAPGGEAAGSLDAEAFVVASTSDGLTMNMTSAAIPAPVNVNMGPVAVDIRVPVISPDTSSDYHFRMALSEFTLNDEVWGLFDPNAALAREPLDFAVDLSGKTKIDIPVLMAAEETGAMPVMPAPDNLDITTLALKVAGAALDATGAFTFDNSMGVPMPLGEANVDVTGANALIDGLIATGLITEDDAMGARMMMGMFMVPGAEPDSLTSKIEAKEGFAIFVNGQQIQ